MTSHGRPDASGVLRLIVDTLRLAPDEILRTLLLESGNPPYEIRAVLASTALARLRSVLPDRLTEHESEDVMRLVLRLAAMLLLETRSSAAELVWTGPAILDAPLRSTAQILGDMIAGAREYVLVIGYRIGRSGPSFALMDDLRVAARRGVRITLIMDNDPKNHVAVAANDWPGHNPPRLLTWFGQDGLASMHAKVTVVDDREALITSANPTWHGLQRNIELGVLLRGLPAIQVRQRFAALERLGIVHEWDNYGG